MAGRGLSSMSQFLQHRPQLPPFWGKNRRKLSRFIAALEEFDDEPLPLNACEMGGRRLSMGVPVEDLRATCRAPEQCLPRLEVGTSRHNTPEPLGRVSFPGVIEATSAVDSRIGG